MKKFLTLSIILLISSILFGQSNYIFLNENNKIEPEISVLEKSEKDILIKISLNSFRFDEVNTPKGVELIPVIENFNNILKEGVPSLPYITKALMIPDNSYAVYEIVSADYQILTDISIAPSKGSILRTINPDDVPYKYGSIYKTNAFFPEEICDISDPYNIRNIKGVNISISPFSYNAISKELKIYKEILVRIKYSEDNSKNTSSENIERPSGEFEKIYSNLFINYSNDSKYTPLAEGTPGKMLIIVKDTYAGEMSDFVKWKREKGIETEMVLTSTISSSLTATQLKSYIQNYYNNNNLTYVLLVGDDADVPSMRISYSEGTCASDNSYAYLAGNDSYADIFIGRFSGNSTANIKTQVERTIHYEKILDETATWLGNAFGSASAEGAGGGHNGESDVQHMNLIRTDLQNYGYTVTHVNESGGSNSQISTALNNGVGVANYIGHGDVDEWVNTSFVNSNVNSLTNENKLPFIWSVACVNGDFASNTCFAETWLRATNNGNPTGAIAFLGSTINQTWVEPMNGQDEMVDILVESYSANIKRTFGGISFNGMFYMIQRGGYGQEMADTWTIFGDPSIMVRTKTPSAMAITHPPVFSIGSSIFPVNCNTENALACLSIVNNGNTEIIGYAYVTGGIANIPLPTQILPGSLKLTVTAYNKITFQSDIQAVVPDGPYIISDSFSINDSQGNNNGFADFGETIKINQGLKNVGIETASNVSAVLSTTHQEVIIQDNTADFGNIASEGTTTVNDAYTIEIPYFIPDQEIIPLRLYITDSDENSWESFYNITVNAPKVELGFIGVNDENGGNNNGRIDENETVKLTFKISNNGHGKLPEGTAILSTESEYAIISIPSIPFNAIDANENEIIEFEVNISDNIPYDDNEICFSFISNSNGYSYSLSMCLPIGLAIEDWESNSFTTFTWENTDSRAWTIVSNEKYEGNYSAKSGNISHSQTTSLKIILDVTQNSNIEFYRKVSCEAYSSWWGYCDYLAFYIDDIQKGIWAGTQDWSAETYEVSTGSREFKWMYIKDVSQSTGSDCAWIDNIILPPFSTSVIVTNEDIEINENKLDIYPNPAKNVVNILFNVNDNLSSNIKIYNISGQVVYELSNIEFEKGANHAIINSDSFVNGNYFVEIITKNEIYRSRFVVNK
ncbi:MAG: C25 family cysteine peptidase [Bacteroidales bacterium]|jgi:hypothetical protein|nr:C25 family cysteine peptidase [Bacteroidales bacterium]